jgi:hypothetical protein
VADPLPWAFATGGRASLTRSHGVTLHSNLPISIPIRRDRHLPTAATVTNKVGSRPTGVTAGTTPPEGHCSDWVFTLQNAPHRPVSQRTVDPWLLRAYRASTAIGTDWQVGSGHPHRRRESP